MFKLRCWSRVKHGDMLKYIFIHLSSSVADGNVEAWKMLEKWVKELKAQPQTCPPNATPKNKTKNTQDPAKTKEYNIFCTKPTWHLTTDGGAHNERNETRYVRFSSAVISCSRGAAASTRQLSSRNTHEEWSAP